MQRDDAAVLVASLASPAAFTTIFDRHFAEIHRFVARRLGTDAADDVAADVFVEAFRCRDRFDAAQPSALPWLYGITTNIVRRHRRREVRRNRAYARVSARDSVHHDVGMEARADADGKFPVVAHALAGLRARDRDVLLLFAWGQLTYDEIAEALEIPVGTVRSRLHRARAQLQQALGAQDSANAPPLRPQPEGGTS